MALLELTQNHRDLAASASQMVIVDFFKRGVALYTTAERNDELIDHLLRKQAARITQFLMHLQVKGTEDHKNQGSLVSSYYDFYYNKSSPISRHETKLIFLAVKVSNLGGTQLCLGSAARISGFIGS